MQRCVEEVQAIRAVPDILQTLAGLTGPGFICVAHVTDSTWTACAVPDRLNFGLKPGDPLDGTTTLCEDVRDTGLLRPRSRARILEQQDDGHGDAAVCRADFEAARRGARGLAGPGLTASGACGKAPAVIKPSYRHGRVRWQFRCPGAPALYLRPE